MTAIFHVMVTKITMWDDTKYLHLQMIFSSYNRLARGFSGIFQPATFEDMGIWSEIIGNPQKKTNISGWIGLNPWPVSMISMAYIGKAPFGVAPKVVPWVPWAAQWMSCAKRPEALRCNLADGWRVGWTWLNAGIGCMGLLVYVNMLTSTCVMVVLSFRKVFIGL